MRSILTGWATGAVLAVVPLAAVAAEKPFSFVAIGDMPYRMPADGVKFGRLIESINTAKPAFTIHVGDIKNGGSPCTERTFHLVGEYFGSFDGALVYTPGDNEWTDCHRTDGDPVTKLAIIRRMFFSAARSLGRTPLKLIRQAETARPDGLPENATWRFGGIRFGTLHVVGSNNNLGRTAAADEEYEARSSANAGWLRQIFAMARSENASGVVLAIHANPGFRRPAKKRTGFNRFLDGLVREVMGFAKPVLLIHGDTHRFRFDQPLFSDPGRRKRIDHFFRLEVMGEAEIHGVTVSVDVARPSLFSVSPLLVRQNLRFAKP